MKSRFRSMARWLAALGVAGVMFAPGVGWGQAQGRKLFKNSVIPLPEQNGPAPHGLTVAAAAPEHKDEKLEIVLALPIPQASQRELEQRVAEGQVIPVQELQTKYGASEADATKLSAWLKNQGFEITRVSPDHTSVYAKATVAQIEKAMEVQFARVTREGRTYTAARTVPSLPEDVGASVKAMAGFQPYRQFRKHAIRRRPLNGNRARLADASGGPVASTNIANAPPYLVSEIAKAYNADGLGLTGAGQKIAIMIDTFPDDHDLALFWKQNHLAKVPPPIEKINVGGGDPTPPTGEETLDVEWANGIAPGATIRLYATGTLEFVALDKALDQILADTASQPNMRQLSMSLGLGETFLANSDGTPSDEVGIEHDKFRRLVAAGVNIFASSGDAGSRPDNTGHSSTGPTQAEFPSSDPFVIGVGGTTLSLNSTGGVSNETGWTGSGGGRSIFFDRPTFQVGRGVESGSKRLVPDISAAADPEKGALIVIQGLPDQIGGTSWSSPVCAGFCA